MGTTIDTNKKVFKDLGQRRISLTKCSDCLITIKALNIYS